MARDYKNSARGRDSNSVPAWLAFTSGLTVGLFVAFLVYLDAKMDTAAPASGSGPSVAGEPVSQAGPSEQARPAIKPKFDFYTILPEMEVKVPDWKISESSDAARPAIDPQFHVLQVGSFQRFEEADRAKAELALQGISADIQRVVINGKDVWYRVRVGPFDRIEQLQQVRAQLIEADKDFMLLKLKPDEA